MSFWFFAHRLSDNLGTTAAILFTMELDSALYFRKKGIGWRRLRANEYDWARWNEIGITPPSNTFEKQATFSFWEEFHITHDAFNASPRYNRDYKTAKFNFTVRHSLARKLRVLIKGRRFAGTPTQCGLVSINAKNNTTSPFPCS